MAQHSKSAQEVLNGWRSVNQHSNSEQRTSNIYKSNTKTLKTFQELLNAKLGVAEHKYTEQEALYEILKGPLSLTTGQHTYSVQELLNMADAAGKGLVDIL